MLLYLKVCDDFSSSFILDLPKLHTTHSNYCDMMFEIKVRKIVINNCQQLSTVVNSSQLQPMPAQALPTAVNKSQ